MQFILNNWSLVLGIVVVLFMLVWGPLRQLIYGIRHVTVPEAVRMVNHEQAVIVDVREASEYQSGRIPKSVNAPLSGLASGLVQLEKYKSRPVIVVCRTSQRSSRAAVMLRRSQFPNVQVLAAGMTGWQKENLPVEK
ncbi:MAG: rhodanese-like domain-containing protein [Gammaproteobacteria bacterium]|nr:rhodanese-like domain-containing protein [Gammaproteobacteria bacterium]